MRRHDQTHPWAGWGEGNRRTIEKSAVRPTFRVSAHLDGRMSKSRFDLWQSQQGIVFAAPDEAKARGHDIGQRSGIAIESVEADQDLGERKRKGGRVTGDGLNGAFQFSAIVSIPWSRIGTHPLMPMSLENGGPRTQHFSALAPPIARSRNLLKTTMRLWQGLPLRQRPLTRCLPGSIHIHDHKLLAHTIPQATRGSERLSRHQILLKERPQRLHRRLIKGRKISSERRAVWQAIWPKERHKCACKRQASLVIRLEGGFAAQDIADKHDDKIDHIVVTEPRSGKADALLDRFQDANMGEQLSDSTHFCSPGRG